MRAVVGRLPRVGLAVGAMALLAACGSTVATQSTATQAAGDAGLGTDVPSSTAPDLTTGNVTAGHGGSPVSAAGTGSVATSAGTSSVAGSSTSSGHSGPVATSVPPPVAGGDRQGITATTIRIGFVGLDPAGQESTNAAFGVTTPPANTKDATTAVVDYINKHGGIAGRRIIPYYVERNTASQDPNEGDSICAQFTDDDHVFAVVTNYTGDAEACYAKHHTLLLEDDNIFGRPALTTWNPYVWSPGLTTAENEYGALVDALVGQGYFKGSVKLGLLAFDDANTKYVYNTRVKPRLAAMHITPEIFYLGSNDGQDKLAPEIQSAELRFKASGVDHVMFMAGGGEAPLVFMQSAQSQQYFPRYALSSSDSPAFLLQGKAPNAELKNAVGAGLTELVDVDSQHSDPYPTGAGEKKCYDVLHAAGIALQSRPSAFGAEYLCDGAFMLQDAAQGLGAAISVQTWAVAAEKLGTTFQAAYSLPNGTEFVQGERTGEAVYRFLAFIDSCKCFQYTSGNRPIPR